ncbi:MAG TPA: cytoplasmic filament protein CfpA, partial [bacterium]|nr:cytoplasmic filament protein CfpA [bacterium]
HQKMAEHLIKDLVSDHIRFLVDKEINEINQQLQMEGRPQLTSNEQVFEKIKAVENYTEDDEGEHSKRYQIVPKYFMDRMKDLGAEVEKSGQDALRVREGISKLLDDNHIRTRGWNTAVNSITAILDTSRMGYQFVHNFKHGRFLQLREYEETDVNLLPDERYEINLKYYDGPQIREEKAAYSAQLKEFQREILRLWDVTEQIYQEEKSRLGFKDWGDVMKETIGRNQPQKRRGWFQPPGDATPAAEKSARAWNEITFVQRQLTSLEELNQTYEQLVTEFKQRFVLVRRRLEQIFGMRFPDTRIIVEERLNFLEGQFMDFVSRVNPYHIQPGLLLEITITSIKRMRATIKGMSNVLNEYLSGISRGFSDRAMTTHDRRRSNVGDAIGHFEQTELKG